MIRNLMLGMSLVTLSTVSAFAAPVAATHHAKAKIVAQAPAADTTAPSSDKPVKKAGKKATAPKKAKTDAKSDSKMDSKGEIAPAGDKVPATDAPKAK
jgi:hypothetical protein